MSRSLDHLRLRDLLLLEQVRELGTLREVAEALHVTQPAVTQMLRALEDAFGLPLVERGRRGVRLTAAGETACRRLRGVRQEIEQARQAAVDQARPVLRLGATPIASLRILPRAIGRLQQRLPQVRVTLSEAGVGGLWRQLSEGQLDAIVGRLPAPGTPLEGLRFETIDRERMVLVARQSHPLGKPGQPRRSLRQWQQCLAQSQWVLPPEESQPVVNLSDWLGQAGEQLPPPVVVSGSFHATLSIVAQADLLSIVPESSVRSRGGALGLTVLRAPWPQPLVDIVFAARETHWDSDPLAQVRGFFKRPA